MEKNNKLTAGKGEEGKWITVNGAHVFVEKGQSVKDAVNTKFDKKKVDKDDYETRSKDLLDTMEKYGMKPVKNEKETAEIIRKNNNDYFSKRPEVIEYSPEDKEKVKSKLDNIQPNQVLEFQSRKKSAFGFDKVCVKKNPDPKFPNHYVIWSEDKDGNISNYSEHNRKENILYILTEGE